MKPLLSSTVVIALIWAFVLTSSFFGSGETMSAVPANFSLGETITILVMPILFFGVMPFWARYSPFYHPTLARLIDAHFGEGSLASFLLRLKPLLLFATTAAIQGGLGLFQASRTNSTAGAYVISGFFISGAIGFALAHWLLHKRKSLGVYPVEKLSGEDRSKISVPTRKPLGEALRAYWKALLGIALFPSVAFMASDYLHVPFEFLALPFFAVCFFAAWPYLSGKAPYTFWLVAMLVYLAGGFFAVLLGYAIRLTLA